jgi:hypothetical protein
LESSSASIHLEPLNHKDLGNEEVMRLRTQWLRHLIPPLITSILLASSVGRHADNDYLGVTDP